MMKFISAVFHPLLMMTYLMLVFYRTMPDLYSPVAPDSIPTLLTAAFITTFLVPVLSIVFMKLTSRIRSFELTGRQERYLPFVSITLFYGATAYMFLHKIGLIPPLSVIMLASTSLIFILLVITFWFKISIHATAAWSFSGYLTALSITQPDMVFFVPLLLSFPMAGLVATSRLWLGYHSPREIWAGIALGYGYSFMTVFVFG